jgi:hypothetical protein
MALETLNKDSKVVVYNSGVELADKGVRKNHQGVAISELNGFIKVLADAPAGGTLGDIVFTTGNSSLNVHNGTNWVRVSLT